MTRTQTMFLPCSCSGCALNLVFCMGNLWVILAILMPIPTKTHTCITGMGNTMGNPRVCPIYGNKYILLIKDILINYECSIYWGMALSRASQGCMRGEGRVQGVSAATTIPATAAHTAPAAIAAAVISATTVAGMTPAAHMPAHLLTCWPHVHLSSLLLANWLLHLLTGPLFVCALWLCVCLPSWLAHSLASLALHLPCICPPTFSLAGHVYTYPLSHSLTGSLVCLLAPCLYVPTLCLLLSVVISL